MRRMRGLTLATIRNLVLIVILAKPECAYAATQPNDYIDIRHRDRLNSVLHQKCLAEQKSTSAIDINGVAPDFTHAVAALNPYNARGWARIVGRMVSIKSELNANDSSRGDDTKSDEHDANRAGAPRLLDQCQGAGIGRHRVKSLFPSVLKVLSSRPGYIRPSIPDTVVQLVDSGGGHTTIMGMIERADINYIRGWACPHLNGSPTRVWLFADNLLGCALNTLCLLPTSSKTDDLKFQTNPAIAQYLRETVVAQKCPDSTSHIGFQLRTPLILDDGKTHSIYAFISNTPDSIDAIDGSPAVFNSNEIYREEEIQDITWNTAIFYTAAALSANKTLHNFFINPSVNDDYDNFNTDHTTAIWWGVPENPVKNHLNIPLEPITGLSVPDSYRGHQIGVNGGAKGVNALQAYGTSIGVSLAPRALSPEGYIQTITIGSNWTPMAAVRPFSPDAKDYIRVDGFFKHPFSQVASVFPHSIGSEGIILYYYTLQFKDFNHCHLGTGGLPACNTIWFIVRLYQEKFADSSEPWDQLKD